jgi:hypothetical protein
VVERGEIMAQRKPITVGSIAWTIVSPALSAILFWLMWNNFTDPAHPVQFSYVLVTGYAVFVVVWAVIGLIALVAELFF